MYFIDTKKYNTKIQKLKYYLHAIIYIIIVSLHHQVHDASSHQEAWPQC